MISQSVLSPLSSVPESMILASRLRRLLQLFLLTTSIAHADGIVWHAWSDEIFAQAKREHKFVYLDLEAVWCHWCHVMDEVTFRDPAVIAEFNRKYLAVRVDQDSRPDLAARYENYGWPATVIYAADGTEIVKKQGYIAPHPMARLLRAVVADPSPVDYGDRPVEATPTGTGTAGSNGSIPSAARLAQLQLNWAKGYDPIHGGWGTSHKFLDWDQEEWALRAAARGDAVADYRARETLAKQRLLVDPVWGGVYQYSVDGDWDEPHFEKIMPMQAENLRIYAQAYAQWGDPADLATARAIRGYLRDFLTSPEGAFYVSQDADLKPGEENAPYFAKDDVGRRAQGIPRIDRHLYARENGWAIAALAQYAAYTGEIEAVTAALKSAHWVIDHRSVGGARPPGALAARTTQIEPPALQSHSDIPGGFRHGEPNDPAGPYLGDTLAMGRAFLALYQVTADPVWLQRAAAAADFIGHHFARPQSPLPLFGYATSDTTHAKFPTPLPEFDENIALARFGLALAAATGRPEYRTMANNSLHWLLAPGMAEARGSYVAGVLLAVDEAQNDPMHLAIVGRKSDPSARSLFSVALRAPTSNKLIEFWDKTSGATPPGENIYPDLPAAAAFVCANGACSSPIAAPGALAARVKTLLSEPPVPPRN